jgi:hypothetical protein
MIKMTKDFKVEPLTPAGPNISGRQVKNIRFAGSGVYYYHKTELPSLGIDSIPDELKDLTVFGVYRPPEVLDSNKDLFRNVYITNTHPTEPVTVDNAKKYMVGITGDTITAELDKKDNELYLYTSGVFATRDALDYYDKLKSTNDGVQLSAGYFPVVQWKDGVHNGKPYHLTMTGMKDGNHVAMVEEARGGSTLLVLDDKKKVGGFNHQKEIQMNLFFDILCRSKGAKDSADKFKLVLDSVKEQEKAKTALSYAEKLLSDVPASDDKTKLVEYINELSTMDGLDADQFVQCRDFIAQLGVKLLKDSKPAEITKPAATTEPAAAQPAQTAATTDNGLDALGKIIGDAVKTGIADAFKDAGIVKDAEPANNKVDDDAEELKKKLEKEEAEKKSCSDGKPTMTIVGSAQAKNGLTSDSIMNGLLGIAPKKEEK